MSDAYEEFLTIHECWVATGDIDTSWNLIHKGEVIDTVEDKVIQEQVFQEFSRRMKHGDYNHIFVGNT